MPLLLICGCLFFLDFTSRQWQLPWTRRGRVYTVHLTGRAHTHIFSRWACHMSLMRTLRGSRCFRVKKVRVIVLCSLPSRSLMSLLNIPHCSFPQVLSSPTCSRSRPSASTTSICVPARWIGMSGRMANPAPNTGYEPNPSNLFSYMDTAHTPIHLPDRHHDFQREDDATVISTTDPEGLPRSGAPSGSKTAASRVPSTFGPPSHWKPMADHASGLGQFRTENLLQQQFLVHRRKVREIKTQTLCIRWKIERISKKSSNGKLTRPSRGEMMAQQKLCEAEAEVEASKRSIKNLNLSDFSYTKQVDGQIRLREKRLVCMDNRNREIGSSKKIMQGIAKKLKNWDERNPTTVSQMMAQIRESQNKVNSLSDAREFYDLEWGSSSGATHVPDRTSTILRPRTLPLCDSGFPRDTLKSKGIRGNFFERPSAREGLSSTILNNSKNFGILSGIEAWYYRIYKEGRKRWKENRWTRRFKCLTSKVEVECWIILVELILTVVWWIIRDLLLRIGILEFFMTLWNLKAGKSTSELRFVHEQPILRSLCSGSKKLRLPNELTNRDRLQGSTIFLTSICLMRWLRQPWRSFSKRSHISENSKCRRAASSYIRPILTRNKLRSWLTSISVQPELMKHYKDSQLCSL